MSSRRPKKSRDQPEQAERKGILTERTETLDAKHETQGGNPPHESQHPNTWGYWLVCAGLFGAYLVLGGLWVAKGRLFGDEGWYAYTSTLWWSGQTPYRDFLFTQTPLTLVWYGWIFWLFGKALWIGRAASIALGGLSLLLVFDALRRRTGLKAGLLGLFLLCLDPSYVWITGTVFTQPLTIFWMALGGWLASWGVPGPKTKNADTTSSPPPTHVAHRAHWWALLLVLNLAVLTRLSMLPALCLLYVGWLLSSPDDRRLALLTGLLNLTVAGVIVALLYGDGKLFFGIYTFHQTYYAPIPLGKRLWTLFFRPFLQMQWPLLLLLGLSLLLRLRQKVKLTAPTQRWVGAMLLTYGLITTIHMLTAIPNALYQYSVIVLLVLATAPTLALYVEEWSKTKERLFWLSLALAMGAQLSSQSYPIMWQGKGSYRQTDKALSLMKQAAPQANVVLTVQTELAFLGGYQVPKGFELGQFSIWMQVSSPVANKYHLVNRKRLFYYVKHRKAQLICLTQRDIRLMFPPHDPHAQSFSKLLQKHYKFVGQVPHYGQFYSPLFIFRAR